MKTQDEYTIYGVLWRIKRKDDWAKNRAQNLGAPKLFNRKKLFIFKIISSPDILGLQPRF